MAGKNIPNKGRGRPKGAHNKLAMTAKEVISQAAEGLGGADRMLRWAKEDPQNEKAFWSSIYPKLLPLQVNGANGGPIEHVVTHGLSDALKGVFDRIAGNAEDGSA